MTTIIFCTDGWRGRIGEDYTFDNVRRCAQGFANYLRDFAKPAALVCGVVIGHDKRFSGRGLCPGCGRSYHRQWYSRAFLRGAHAHAGHLVSRRCIRVR